MVLIDVESENGWRPASLSPGDPLLVWKTIPGTNPPVNIQVMRGLPEVFLPAWAADWNTYVEPLRDADSASYTPTNSVSTSNHLNGTAEDLDWDNHPFEVVGTVTDAQRATITDMLDFYEGWMFWAGNWDDPVDEMHSQLGYNTWNRNTAALDFIARKIRSDGLSTFRRGPLAGDPPAPAAPAAPTPAADDGTDTATKVLYDAVPVIDMDRAAELVDAVMTGAAAALCTNASRLAMYLAQTGHEADGYATTEEYASGADYDITVNRELALELGNTEPGDGVKYKGRGWIMCTGKGNYGQFSAWAHSQGLVDTPTYFVDNPTELADLKWAGIVSAWYWTVARPTINKLADAGDVVNVTQLINGGQNGIDDRQARYNQAVAVGSRLLLLITPPPAPPTTGDGPLDALTPEEQHQLLDDVAYIKGQLGPSDPSWGADSSFGVDADGNQLTLRDGLAETKRAVESLQTATSLARKAAPAKKATPKVGGKTGA